MKIWIILAALCLSFTTVSATQVEDAQDCDPDEALSWMIEHEGSFRQIHSLMAAKTDDNVIETVLSIQAVRRTLEDVERPACADDLYILTIYYMNALTDYYLEDAYGDDALADSISENRFNSVDLIYETREAYAIVEEFTGRDIFQEAIDFLNDPANASQE
jgi:hypothetical protein